MRLKLHLATRLSTWKNFLKNLDILKFKFSQINIKIQFIYGKETVRFNAGTKKLSRKVPRSLPLLKCGS